MVYLEAPDDLVATASYAPVPAAVAIARRFVRDTLRSWQLDGGEIVDDAVLLTSELVTNAVLHAGTQVQVTCRLAAGTVEIAVIDRHPVWLRPAPLTVGTDPAERVSGRGLLLPRVLASAWGVTYGRTVKSVWFRITLPQQRVPAPGRCRADTAAGDTVAAALAADHS